MQVKQTVVIIGAGDSGKAIATCLACGHLRVLLCDKVYSKAEALVKELKDAEMDADIEAMPCFFDGAWEADIVILAIAIRDQKDVAEIIKEVVNQKVVACIFSGGAKGNSLIPSPASAMQSLRQLLPNTKLVSIGMDQPLTKQSESCTTNTVFDLSGGDIEAVELVRGMLGNTGTRK